MKLLRLKMDKIGFFEVLGLPVPRTQTACSRFWAGPPKWKITRRRIRRTGSCGHCCRRKAFGSCYLVFLVFFWYSGAAILRSVNHTPGPSSNPNAKYKSKQARKAWPQPTATTKCPYFFNKCRNDRYDTFNNSGGTGAHSAACCRADSKVALQSGDVPVRSIPSQGTPGPGAVRSLEALWRAGSFGPYPRAAHFGFEGHGAFYVFSSLPQLPGHLARRPERSRGA